MNCVGSRDRGQSSPDTPKDQNQICYTVRVAKSVIFYFAELGCFHTQRARSDQGLHTARNIFLNSLWVVFSRDKNLTLKRSEMSAAW